MKYECVTMATADDEAERLTSSTASPDKPPKSCLDSWLRRHKRPLGEHDCQIDLDQ